MPTHIVEKLDNYTVPPAIMSGGALGPAAGAVVITVPLGAIAGQPQTVVRALLLPAQIVALDADSTTFELETSAGTVIATGSNAAAIPVAGLALTLDAAQVNLAVGTALRLVITNVANGQNLSAVHVTLQVELQPT